MMVDYVCDGLHVYVMSMCVCDSTACVPSSFLHPASIYQVSIILSLCSAVFPDSLTSLRDEIISGPYHWFLLVADWTFGGRNSYISLGDWKSMLLSPCIASILAAMANLFMSLVRKH